MPHGRIALLAFVTFVSCKGDGTKQASAATAQDPPKAAATDPIGRGKYLVTVAACNDCHTPQKLDPKLNMPMPDMSRMFSGHPEGGPTPEAKPGPHDQAVIGPTFTSFRLPFGTVYSANITPDPETGIGGWNEATFVASMRTGRHLGSKSARPILPPMPWSYLAHMTDEDLKAMFAYLRSIPPVKNRVPPPDVPPEVLQDLGKAYDTMLANPKSAM